MSMKDELSAVTEHLVANLGSGSERLFSGQIDQARDFHVSEHGLRAGATVPRFTLPGATGEAVDITRLLEKGPVVLVFYRGGWCPYCNIHLRSLQQALPDIRNLGATLVAISPATPDNSLSTREREALEFPVLSDLGNVVAREFGLVFTVSEEAQDILKRASKDIDEHNGVRGGELPVPATYVIDQCGRILFGEPDIDYRRRVDPKVVLDVLKEHRGENG